MGCDTKKSEKRYTHEDDKRYTHEEIRREAESLAKTDSISDSHTSEMLHQLLIETQCVHVCRTLDGSYTRDQVMETIAKMKYWTEGELADQAQLEMIEKGPDMLMELIEECTRSQQYGTHIFMECQSISAKNRVLIAKLETLEARLASIPSRTYAIEDED